MLSNKLIVAAFATLASLVVVDAGPCKPLNTKAITTSATGTASAGFMSSTELSGMVETSTAITESKTKTKSETATKVIDKGTTMTVSVEASTTVASTKATIIATITTVAEGPPLVLKSSALL